MCLFQAVLVLEAMENYKCITKRSATDSNPALLCTQWTQILTGTPLTFMLFGGGSLSLTDHPKIPKASS